MASMTSVSSVTSVTSMPRVSSNQPPSMPSVSSVTSMARGTSVIYQPPSISTHMASTMENHELPSHNLREENLEHTAKGGHLQVKVGSKNKLDTANYSPKEKEEPAAEGTTMSSSSKATNMLDKLLARSAILHQKLDKLAHPRPTSSRALKMIADTGARTPSAVLDRCLSRAKELNDRVDRMSTELKTPTQQVHVAHQTMRNTPN